MESVISTIIELLTGLSRDIVQHFVPYTISYILNAFKNYTPRIVPELVLSFLWIHSKLLYVFRRITVHVTIAA